MTASPRPNPHQIAAFNVTAREQSFSKAAKALNVTQSAITQHISKLEKAIGTELFIRRRSGLELTHAGKEIFALSDRIHVLNDLLMERIREYSELAGGQLQIVANAPCPALGFISKFKKLHPKVHIEFSLDVWAQTMEQIKNRKTDIAIITEPENIEGLYKRKIDETRYVALVLKDHPFAKKRAVTMKELSETSVILPNPGSLTRRVFEDRMAELNLTPTSVTTVTTFPLSKEAVLHGVGVGIILEGAYSPTNRLKSIPIKDLSQKFCNYAVCPIDKKDLRLVSRFMELSEE